MTTSNTPKAFHIMAKPTGSACNMRCGYCFFLKKESLYPGSNFRMSAQVHEAYIRQLLEFHRDPRITVAWQGGEPTLMGLDFFRHSVELQKKHQKAGIHIENTFQTNGILLNDEWCRFFHENNFLVGLSMDGPGALHDFYRKDRTGRGTFDRVVQAARLLLKHKVECNILCTVNSKNAGHPLEVYRFFRDELGFSYIQFIPIVEGRSGQGFYNDAMVYHDDMVGILFKKLDDLGIADNTIVMYGTDNGPHYNSWPDAGITPFRSEKNTNWEGAFRVPAFVRWPAKIPAGTVLNGIVSHQDWLPTLLAAAGEPDIKAKLLKGHKAGAKTFKVCIDGFNMLAYLTGEVKKSPREAFFYVNDDAQLVALRFNDWKMVFMEQRAKTCMLWAEPFVSLRVPKIFNLRRDPFERADENSNTYWDWMFDHVFLLVPAQAYVAQQLQSLAEFPPRQKPATFNMDRVLDQLRDASGSGMH